MGLLKEKKKLKIKTRGSGSGSGIESSPLRPKNVEKKPPCIIGCPNGNDIRTMVMAIAQTEKFERNLDESLNKAWEIFAETTPFPAVCGRVCPHPCEGKCNRNAKEGSVAVNNIERFLGDYALEHKLPFKKLTDETYPEKIAVIGSGPAGMSCAYQLTRRGYKVTVFEALPQSGGMLRYGIPDYRLPPEILDAEYQRLVDFGIEIKMNTLVGRDISLEKLRSEYSIIFAAIGAHKGRRLGIPGEELSSFFTGTDFLRKYNMGEKLEIGDHTVVVGGGDTAIDAARSARRFGSQATILYRRTRTEMPAIDEEIIGAEEEDVQFHYLAIPLEITKDGNAHINIKCQRMELGEPDSSGRRRPVPIEGDYFDLRASTLVAAISQEPDFEGLEEIGNPKDWIKVDEKMQTQSPNVFGGGDAYNLGLVIDAIYHGRIAAQSIDAKLRGKEIPPAEKLTVIEADKMLLSYYEPKERGHQEKMPPAERLANPEAEIARTLTQEQMVEEAKRCMSCGYCFDCGECWSYCQDGAVLKPLIRGELYKFKMDFCNGCKKCAEQCPCGFIEMH